MSGGTASLFNGADYLVALPIMLVALFAIGILLIDLMLPQEWKWANAVTALAGLVMSGAAITRCRCW